MTHIDSLGITNKQSNNIIFLNEIVTITDANLLLQQLNEDISLVNRAMFENDIDSFKIVEEDLKKIGYKLKYGLTVGSVKQSIYCYSQNIVKGQCVGGYSLTLDGKGDAQSLFKLVQLLNNQNIKIYEFFIPGKLSRIQNLESITSVEQMNQIIKEKNSKN